ncbi:hypothetical protein [Flavobacterium anhuiense]|mgnify:FL=1|uniref:hypothetical protein n=1 Tax=Flavobacterium anhuiense TaxID=459526 RepID=UPI003D95B398
MKIVKSSFFSPRKCKYGDFEMIPDGSWEFSYAFIDYESKLLIASFSNRDKSTWENFGYNGTFIPSKQYIIDLKTLRILEFEDWKHYFDYNKIEIKSEDKKYKLISQRIFDAERNNDTLHEELYDNETGELMSRRESVAFSENKSENLLEAHYRHDKEIEEKKRIFDAKPNLSEFYLLQCEKLNDNDAIIGYYDDNKIYRLTFLNNKFILSRAERIPNCFKDRSVLKFFEAATYSDIDEFWSEFIKDENWYVKFKVDYAYSEKALVLAKHVTEYLNEVRKSQKATFKDYETINEWQGKVWSDDYKKTEIKQWCSNCFKNVYYYGRYPKYICHDCSSKEIYDENGNYLDFFNLGFSGGFKSVTKNAAGEIIKEVDTEQFCDCIIDGKLFFAQEARFGGIVIQLKE